MADATVLKEFLVQLGFKVDPSGERRFLDSIGAATVKAVALGTAVTATAGMVVAGVARIAENLEQLYFASQRTNASVENLQAVGFAAKQMGVDSAAALGAVESLARFLRNSPGGEGLLKNLGVNTRDARGAMRDTVDLMGDLGKKFASMPYYKAHAFAQALGIDEKTLMAMRSGMGEFQSEYKEMLRAAGMDSQDAAKQSHGFMVELRTFGSAFQILVQKIGASLMGPMGASIRRARETLVANFDRITAVVGNVLALVMRITTAIVALAIRGGEAIGWLIDWFRGLSPTAKMVIEIIGGILIAWKALSAGFLATPLGRVIALVSALLMLWDDYKTWKEGGKSLIDWAAWAPGIEAAIRGIKTIGAVIHDGLSFLGDWRPAFEILLTYVTGKWMLGMLGAIGRVGAAQAAASAGGALGAAGPALAVAAAGAAGYGVGTLINRQIDGTPVGDAIGSGVAHVMAFLGSQDAKDAIATNAAMATSQRSASGSVSTAPTATNPNDPRGVRNNNPGNINFGDWARAHGATGIEPGKDGRFATFANAQAGLDALGELLRSKGYIGGGRDTVASILEKYAPRKDNNDTDMYIRMVAKRLGVDANAHLDPRNMQQMNGLIDGIVRVENGMNPYSREMIAHAAGGAPPVSVSQSTTITVHTDGDAKEVAREVAGAQNGVNSQLIRNTRGAVLQ